MWDSVKPMLNPSSVDAWYYVYVMSRITVIEFMLIKDPLYKKNLGLFEIKDENFCKLHLSHISSNGLRFLLFLVTDYQIPNQFHSMYLPVGYMMMVGRIVVVIFELVLCLRPPLVE